MASPVQSSTLRRPSTLRRRVTAAASATLAAGALVLAGLSSSASAGSSSSGDPTDSSTGASGATGRAQSATAHLSPGLLKAMSEDLGLTRTQAKTRLANEAEASETVQRLRASLGAGFAGAHVSGPTADRLTVATTEAAGTSRIEAAGATARVVDNSLARLDGVKKALDRTARSLDRTAKSTAPRGVPVWYVDVKGNRVVVEAVRTASARAFLDRAGVDPSKVTIRHSTAQPRTFADLRGGDAYYMGGSGRCSIGFPVTQGGGQGGFVTAGHCGTPGTTTTGYNQQAQGSFQGSTFPGRDYAWVAANSNWTPRPLVNGYGNGDVTVTGSTEAVEGSSVCRSGSTTGWHCGSVQQRNTSVSYPQGTVSGVTRTSVCAEPGDSGGSFISGSQAQGVTSGGSGNCSQGGTTFFQPVNPALQAYGLTLVTSGNGGPTDPPTDPIGTWSVGKTYQAGDTATHGGASYRCLQGHTSQPGWEPPNAPALWARS